MEYLKTFWNEEQGQDLIEYTLLMAFIALASAALFLGTGESLKGLWTSTNHAMANASAVVSAGY